MKNLYTLEANGEITDNTVNDILNEKHRPDSPMDRTFVPYLIMAFCLAVDLTIFMGLFKMISHDSPEMIAVQVVAFLICFDVVPVFLGIMLRRYKAGLPSSKFMMILALGVFTGAFIVNIVLRIQTIDLLTPVSSTAPAFGSLMETEAETASSVGSEAIAQTIFATVIPLLTSAASFFISFITFSPLNIMRKRYEKLLAIKRDELRRVQAIISEYFPVGESYEDKLLTDERVKYSQASLAQRSKLVKLMLYSRAKLIEQLNDPAATSAISADDYSKLLEKVNTTLDATKGGEL